jgi:hypothetical protein
MKTFVHPQPFETTWSEPHPRFQHSDVSEAPLLPLEVFGEAWAECIAQSAEVKSSPPDYVVASLLAVAGSAIGNTRWVSPWQGWSEPPILWTMAIGAPSSNKSPGMDAILTPQKEVERLDRQSLEKDVSDWSEKSELAKLRSSTWREQAKAALKEGQEPPEKPSDCGIDAEPFSPRYAIADGTVERLAVIVAKQPRGTLLARDELAGWLQGMTRYSGGGSDRPFWLEAYGGRGYTVERMGREPVHVDRLAIGVTGAIQPDRLKSLLMKSDDDGLLARFIPIWPEQVPICRPSAGSSEVKITNALRRLYGLRMVTDESDKTRPWIIPFTEAAKDALDRFRIDARHWETDADGLLLSFIGKLPGMAARLSLILAFLDWAIGEKEEPYEIQAEHFGRAIRFVGDYALPMARRAYAQASISQLDRQAHSLIAIFQKQGWTQFTSREILRLNGVGMNRIAELNPVLAVLEEGDVVRAVDVPSSKQGGRPARIYTVNPAILPEGP